ncbi:hypothetical protein OGH69_00570 [Flavobacterium sp. MFBS3-15]|nr:hypothetical protein [Flavobacterium sp. MFBS3-15]MCW4467447.1 hypothetical protein [Flavobacterium sp. MFBS3-15]
MSTLSYTQFLWQSVDDHGIHSPFMFRFVSKAFISKMQGFLKLHKL